MGGIRRAIASVSSPLCGNHFLVCTFAVKQGPNVRMSGFLPSTIDTIGGGVSTQRKNMNTKKYLKPPLSIDNIALHMIATNFNPLQVVLDGFTSKTKIQKKTCLVLRWAVSVTLSTMYEPKFGHVIGMSQKIAPKIDAPWVKNVYISSNLGEEHGCIPLSP